MGRGSCFRQTQLRLEYTLRVDEAKEMKVVARIDCRLHAEPLKALANEEYVIVQQETACGVYHAAFSARARCTRSYMRQIRIKSETQI